MNQLQEQPMRPWLFLPLRLRRVGLTFRRLPLHRVDFRGGWRRVHHLTEWRHGARDAVDATDAPRRVEISRGFVSPPTDNVVNRPGHVAAVPSRVEVVDRANRHVVHRLPHVRWRRGRPRGALRDVWHQRSAQHGSRRVVVVVALRHLRVRLGLRARAGAGLLGGRVEAEEVVRDLRDDRGGLGSAALDGTGRRGIELVDEPLVGGGVADAGEHGAERARRGVVRRGGEEEEAQAGRLDGGGGEAVDAVELLHEVVDVVVGGDGDERVEVVVRELVPERRGGLAGDEERGGELGERGEEDGVGGGARDGDDAGLAADVAELVVARARQDAAAEAAHEAHERGPVRLRTRRRRVVVAAAAAVAVAAGGAAGPGAGGGGGRGGVVVVRRR
uniref:Uncharacterized protein n=1 Tax=Triticum urartu TaxID=4572 RepID=A0A8R7TFI8_TRIUA